LIPDLGVLPGGDLVMQGLRDLQAGSRDSVAALLVQIGRPRLARAGLAIPDGTPDRLDAELRLYARLVADGEPDPYSAYNALIRRLVSCEAALEHPGTRLR
jgi:hypothetical protein